MKVSEVISRMQRWFEPDDIIAIDWFEKDDFYEPNGKPITDEEWEHACYHAEDAGFLIDRDTVEIWLQDARRKQNESNN